MEEENALLKDKIKMLEELAVSAYGPCWFGCVFIAFLMVVSFCFSGF